VPTYVPKTIKTVNSRLCVARISVAGHLTFRNSNRMDVSKRGANANAHDILRLEKVVRRVLNAVRSFSFDGDSLAEDIDTLRTHLATRQDFFEVVRSTTELQAVSLVFDYEDSRSGSFSPAVFIVGRQMLVVWALMAYALWMHRNNKLRQMSEVLHFVGRHRR
jgi:hypothetical protein